jgi:hypothetical protein
MAMALAMHDDASLSLAQRALRAATQAATLRAEFAALAPDDSLRLALFSVKSSQAVRLASTYSDLLKNERYQAAARFFLDDLYGIHDLSQRDQSVLRMLPTLVKLLPGAALKTVVEALEMDALSETLDWAVARNVSVMCARYMSVVDPSSPDWPKLYRDAYVNIDNPERRVAQIAMVLRIGTSLDALVKKPLLGSLLKTMAAPARAAGLAAIHDFLMRGFSAFKQMKGANEFLGLIQERELAQDEHLRLNL